MDLTGERLIPASIDRTWAALNDPEVLKGCIAGCESLERGEDGSFNAQLALRIGPVSARFKGHLTLLDVQPPTSYTMQFDGQGGAAGFGKGTAEVRLAAQDATHTTLSYTARAQVGGKIAQIGSRLVDAAAAKVAEDFFQAFEARLAAEAAPAPVPEVAAPPPAVATPSRWQSSRWALAAVVIAAVLGWWLTRN